LLLHENQILRIAERYYERYTFFGFRMIFLPTLSDTCGSLTEQLAQLLTPAHYPQSNDQLINAESFTLLFNILCLQLSRSRLLPDAIDPSLIFYEHQLSVISETFVRSCDSQLKRFPQMHSWDCNLMYSCGG